MSTPNPPARKKLPIHPSAEHLRKQAKRLAKSQNIPLAQSQHQLAHDYGAKNWPELLHIVETMLRGATQLQNVKNEMEPLPKAANANDLPLVEQILNSGQFTQHDLDLALARSILRFNERKTIAQLLLDHGADPDGQYGSNYGPIIFVTGECLDPEGLQFLIDAGADVTFPAIETKYGKQSPLSYWLGTYVRGQNEAKHRGIQILLQHQAQIPDHIPPELLAIHQGDAQTLHQLLTQNPTLTKKHYPQMPYGNILLTGATLLHAAVEFNELDCITTLLNHHADINTPALPTNNIGNQTPLFHAITALNNAALPTLELLISRVGQYINSSLRATFRHSDGRTQSTPVTPLEYAELSAQPTAPNWLRPNEKTLTLLHSLDRRSQIKSAILQKNLPLVTQLLDQHPDLLTPELWPPTIYEAQSLEITTLLLSRNLSPNECSAPRKPLHLAVYQHLPDIVDLLLAHHADPNQLNPLNERPLDLLDAYEPRPLNDPASARIRQSLLNAGAAEDLHSAIRANNLPLIEKFLDADPTLLTSQSPWPPLHTAARSARLEPAKLLLARGAPVDQPNNKQNTPLWFACHSPANDADRFLMIQLLLSHHANPNTPCENNTTPLHQAARRGPASIVFELLGANGDPRMTDDKGRTPLDYANEPSVNRDQSLTMAYLKARQQKLQPQPQTSQFSDAFLLAATPNPTEDHRAGTTAQAEKILAENPTLPLENFLIACTLGLPTLISHDLSQNPTLATQPGGPRNWPPLCYLTFSKFLRTKDSPLTTQLFLQSAQLLLNAGANPNSHFTMPNNPTEIESALYGAAGIANNPDLTALLLQHGADPNDHETLYHASEHQDNAALKILLPKITDPTWLAYCMCHKMDMEDPAGLLLFLQHNANPNLLLTHGQRQGDRPLHFALHRHRSPKIIQLLLQHGADPNLPDAANQPPYHLALKLGQLDSANLMLQHGALDNAPPKLKLLAALSTGNAPAALQLLTLPPSPIPHSAFQIPHSLLQEITPEDHTLLIDAAQSGNNPALTLMLSPPFNFPIETRKPAATAWDGTPLHHACYFAHPTTVQLLLTPPHHANPHLLHAYGGNALTTTLHAALHTKNPSVDLPLHLQTLTHLAPHFSKEALQKSLTQLPPDAPTQLRNRLQSLLQNP